MFLCLREISVWCFLSLFQACIRLPQSTLPHSFFICSIAWHPRKRLRRRLVYPLWTKCCTVLNLNCSQGTYYSLHTDKGVFLIHVLAANRVILSGNPSSFWSFFFHYSENIRPTVELRIFSWQPGGSVEMRAVPRLNTQRLWLQSNPPLRYWVCKTGAWFSECSRKACCVARVSWELFRSLWFHSIILKWKPPTENWKLKPSITHFCKEQTPTQLQDIFFYLSSRLNQQKYMVLEMDAYDPLYHQRSSLLCMKKTIKRMNAGTYQLAEPSMVG